MLKNIMVLILLLVSINEAFADDDVIVVYVALSEIKIDGKSGTSEGLNSLALHYGSRTGNLKHALSKGYPQKFSGRIDVYNLRNIHYIHSDCNYATEPIRCGVRNNHWTLKTFVTVGDKYSTIVTKLYDSKAREISGSIKTRWGTIRYLPQWKITKVKEVGGFGGGKMTEILELYPPKIEEVPPLIRPYDIQQSISMTYLSAEFKD